MAVLLPIKPTLKEISQAVLGNINAGNSLIDCFTAAAAYPFRFDESYKGNKDRQSNFGMYGDPVGSIIPESLTWAYNETDTKTFVVTTNKTRWHFGSESSYEDFTVTVWDATNTTQITNGIYTTGMVVRVTPIGNNEGVSNKYCYIYIATDPDTMMEGCTMIGTQTYEGYGDPPIVVIGCDDETMTLTGIDNVLEIGSRDLWIQFTPDDITPTPPRTIYITVTKSGPVVLCQDSITNCYNNAMRSKWIEIDEDAVEGRHYYVNLSTSNA